MCRRDTSTSFATLIICGHGLHACVFDAPRTRTVDLSATPDRPVNLQPSVQKWSLVVGDAVYGVRRNCDQNALGAKYIGLINELVWLGKGATDEGEDRAKQVCCLSICSSVLDLLFWTVRKG